MVITTRRASAALAATTGLSEGATENPGTPTVNVPTITDEQLSAVGYTRLEFTALNYDASQVNALISAANNIITKQSPASPTAQRQIAFDTMFQDQTKRVIPGFNDDKPISRLQNAFRMVLMDLGVNMATAEELFRHGYSSFEEIKGLDPIGIKGIISSVNKYKHGKCPNPSKVFIGRRFSERMHLLVSWVEFLPTIGDIVSASGWNEIAEEWTRDRLRSIKEDDELEAATTLELPEPLTKMSNFRKFDDQLRAYLRHKRGVTKAPLLYLLREDDKVEVDDNDRGGHVGDTSECEYPDWASYYIRCTVHEGRHYQKDNVLLWSILFKLVGSGPGWSYIQLYGNKSGSRGDGRKAYYALYNQAYELTNVRHLCEAKRQFIKSSSFTGHSQRYDFDKHKQLWFEAKETLTRHGRSPNEEEKLTLLQQLRKTSHYFSQSLGIKEMQSNRKRSLTRNVSSFQGSNSGRGGRGGRGNRGGRGGRGANNKRPKYDGPLKAQYYDRKTWNSMSKEQKDTVLRLKEERDANAPNSKKARIASSSANDDSTPRHPAGNQFGAKVHYNDKNSD